MPDYQNAESEIHISAESDTPSETGSNASSLEVDEESVDWEVGSDTKSLESSVEEFFEQNGELDGERRQ